MTHEIPQGTSVEQLRYVYAEIDKKIAEDGETKTFPCGNVPCAGECCTMYTDIFPIEALSIAKHCQEIGLELDLNRLKEKMQKRKVFRYKKSKFNDELDYCYFWKEGKCSIYAARPLVCRTTFMTCREACAGKIRQGNDVRRFIFKDVSEIFWDMCKGISLFAKKSCEIELHKAMYRLLSNRKICKYEGEKSDA